MYNASIDLPGVNAEKNCCIAPDKSGYPVLTYFCMETNHKEFSTVILSLLLIQFLAKECAQVLVNH